MNTLKNIQKQGERNSQEIDHLQISDDNASKSPQSYPWFQNCEDGYLAIKVLPPHQAIYQQHILHHQYNCSTL